MELINREEVVNLICDSKDLKELFDRVYDEIPIIESRPKGKWIRHQAGIFDYHYCSICKERAEALQDGGGCELLSNYCPHCGADMREEK